MSNFKAADSFDLRKALDPVFCCCFGLMSADYICFPDADEKAVSHISTTTKSIRIAGIIIIAQVFKTVIAVGWRADWVGLVVVVVVVFTYSLR